MAGSGTAHLRPEDETLLRVDNLVVEFPVGRSGLSVHAVSDISLDVKDGETLGLVGESGCGKSTTGKAIMQLPPPKSGRVVFEGHDMTALHGDDLRRTRTRMKMIFQDPISSLNPRRKVEDIISEGLRIAVDFETKPEDAPGILKLASTLCWVLAGLCAVGVVALCIASIAAGLDLAQFFVLAVLVLSVGLLGFLWYWIGVGLRAQIRGARYFAFWLAGLELVIGLILSATGFPIVAPHFLLAVAIVIVLWLPASRDAFPGKPPGLDEKIDEMMALVGLDPNLQRGRRPHQFSGGQCQRISIARAVITEPKLIICDEPVSALDVSVQAQILNLLEDMKARYGLTLIFIAHDLAVVKNVSDRVVVMYLGKICEVASPDLLYKQPAHPYTAALLAAIPVPDPNVKPDEREQVGGEIPSPVAPPSGCRFRTRCPKAQDLCAQQEPEIREIHAGQYVACHFPLSPGETLPSSNGQGVVSTSG
jgi:oligopeptide/dipeptide ABC transporter ATP-binding protein